MISQEFLETLRCPACVSGPTRKPGNDPGRLELVGGVWLVCQESGCGRKYPIIDDIARMTIEIGEAQRDTPVDRLGEPKE
jgi:uncharacterized protein YbaR (Trm112 family)